MADKGASNGFQFRCCRDLRGPHQRTGSHTSIAGHLKIWRDDHAQKVVRHLPATLPECRQKEIELAVTIERLEKQRLDFENKSAQYDSKLQRSYNEKEALIEKNILLKKNILALQEKMRMQAQQTQDLLTEEHARHEQSENRWLTLIDTARQESKDLQKRLEKLAEIITLNQVISELRQELFQKDICLKEALTKKESLQKESLRKDGISLKNRARGKIQNKALQAG